MYREAYDPSYSVDNLDDEADDFIPSVFLTEDEADNLFGLGNKQKKAKKKLAKSEKKLAKGKTKAAERKIGKAEKLLGKVQSGVDTNQPKIDALQNQIASINSTTSPAQTESMATPAGQIGNTAQPIPQSSMSSGGGGGGDVIDSSGEDMAMMSPDAGTTDTTTSADNTSLSTPDNPITLPDVTVTANKGISTKTILIVIGAIVALYFGYKYFIKKK